MQTKQNVGIQFDVWEIVMALIQKIWLIVLAMILGGVVAFCYTLFMVSPLYKTSAMLYVNNSSSTSIGTKMSISTADISGSRTLVDTYIVILKSRTTLESVIEEAKLDYTYEQLKNMISASSVNGTEVLSVTVTSTSPEEAELIANTIADVLPKTIAMIMEGSSVRIVDYAIVPGGKASPSLSNNTFKGMFAGVVLAAGLIALMTLLDYKIHSEQYILDNYPDVPLLAVIPDIGAQGSSRRERKGSHYYYSRPTSTDKQ